MPKRGEDKSKVQTKKRIPSRIQM